MTRTFNVLQDATDIVLARFSAYLFFSYSFSAFYDCPRGEDEKQCYFACPGYFVCNRLRMCLHPTFVCDGIRHCPYGEDEGPFCNMTCPKGCSCRGVEFTCTEPFDSTNYIKHKVSNFDSLFSYSFDKGG